MGDPALLRASFFHYHTGEEARPILATASRDLVIRLWNVEAGTRLEDFRGPLVPPSVLSFSPGGTRLATAAPDGVVCIWEPRCLAEPSLARLSQIRWGKAVFLKKEEDRTGQVGHTLAS